MPDEVKCCWPDNTTPHQTNYRRDWEGQEFFYVMDKRQSGVKKIMGNKLFLRADDAATYALECHARMGSIECYYEVRPMICPYIASEES
jgi:hypothetical protein